jgi:hypothetical protein
VLNPGYRPRIEPEGELEPDEQDRLYRHYQRDGGLQTYSESRGLPGAGNVADPTAGTTGPGDTGPSRLRRYDAAGDRSPGAPVKREDVLADHEPASGSGSREPGGGEVFDDGSHR